MSIASALKLAKFGKALSATGSVAVKVGPKVSKAIEIIDATADMAVLTDQICLAAMGEDYDPAFRDLVEEVAKIGKDIDGMVAEIRHDNVDANHLNGAIDNLNFALSLENDKSEMIVELIDKIGDISLTLKDVPTALTWVQGPAARTDIDVDLEEMTENLEKVAAYKGSLGADPALVGLLSASLLLRGAIYALKRRRKARRKAQLGQALDDNDLRPKTGLRPRAHSVGSLRDLRKEDRRAIKALRGNNKLSTALSVTSYAAGAVSLGFTIASIVQRVNSRKSAFKELNKQLEYYKRAQHAYLYCLYGYDGSDVPQSVDTSDRTIHKGVSASKKLKNKAKALFDAQKKARELDASGDSPVEVNKALIDARKAFSTALENDSDFTRARDFFLVKGQGKWSEAENIGLALGLKGLINNYNIEGREKVSAVRAVFEEMIAILSGELHSADETDRAAMKFVTDDGDLGKIEEAKKEFETYAKTANDVFKSGAERSESGFDMIQSTFSQSLQALLSRTLADAQDRLRDIRFASQLYAAAQLILRRADEEEAETGTRDKAILKAQEATIEFVRSTLQSMGQPSADEDVLQFMREKGMIAKTAAFDRAKFLENQIEIDAESQWRASDLDTRPTERFKDERQAQLVLKMMVDELGQTQRQAEGVAA